MSQLPKILYRAYAEQDGERFSFPRNEIIEGTVWYEEYHVLSYTPAGCYVRTYAGSKQWVSLTHLKRFAYPTKKEALDNLVGRRKKWLKILERQLEICKAELKVALRQQAREAAGSVGVEPASSRPDEIQEQNPPAKKETQA